MDSWYFLKLFHKLKDIKVGGASLKAEFAGIVNHCMSSSKL